MSKSALIIGAGSGLSASLARLLHSAEYQIALVARNTDKLQTLAQETGALCLTANADDDEQMAAVFAQLETEFESLDVVVFNPSARVGGPIADLDPSDVKNAMMVTAFGGFLAGKHAARRMQEQGHGTILFTGATASVKGFAEWSSFAMGKFALRGLAESMARELGPKNIHVAHFIIDGGIESKERGLEGDQWLNPDAIAQTYLDTIRQDRSAWAFEVDLRPWVEKF
ncbi:MAG: SDR family NAD(P)-dependent oxidoreductase [Pseudomonadota bacterium]